MESVETSLRARVGIQLNGETFEVPAGTTVSSLLQLLDLPADRVAVELNREIVRQHDWEETQIGSGASVEVVHFVGGG